MCPEVEVRRQRTSRFCRRWECGAGVREPRGAIAATALALTSKHRASGFGGKVRQAKVAIVSGRRWPLPAADVRHGSELNPRCF